MRCTVRDLLYPRLQGSNGCFSWLLCAPVRYRNLVQPHFNLLISHAKHYTAQKYAIPLIARWILELQGMFGGILNQINTLVWDKKKAPNELHRTWTGELRYAARGTKRRTSFWFFFCGRLTQQDDDTEQYGHQGSGGEAIWEGQHLGAARLHVAAAVAGAHAHDQRAGAALDGVVVVRDHHGQEVHAHLAAAEAPPPRQDIGSVVCGGMRSRKGISFSAYVFFIFLFFFPLWRFFTTCNKVVGRSFGIRCVGSDSTSKKLISLVV